MDFSAIKRESSHYLKNLIRINTSNPPGNEMQAVNYLASIASENDLDYEIFETASGRGNILIKLTSKQPVKPPLVMISHLDVVPADPKQWSVDPFAGWEQNGMIWGRGAIDDKQLTVMELMVLLLLKRHGVTPNRDIYVLATADEETGGRLGMMTMIERLPHLFQNSDVISEGGGFPISVNGKVFYLCEIGQKGHAVLRLAFPKSQHSSPFLPDNDPILACSHFLLNLQNFQWPGELPKSTYFLINRLASACNISTSLPLTESISQIGKHVSPSLVNLLKAMIQNTLTATIWQGGKQFKDIKNAAELWVDVRMLPGVDRLQLDSVIATLTAGLPVEIEVTHFSQGYESDFNSPLFNALAAAIRKRLPFADVVPFIATGASDGRFLQQFHANVCGFSPVLIEDLPFDKAISMVHGVDERISADSLVFGIDVLYEAVASCC